jgi:dextranase
VYAAEPEFFRRHRNWGLYGADGSSYRLGKLFHLMDVAPNSAWVRYLLGDFRRTLRAVPFDGLHLDQYGFPRVAYAKTGALRDIAQNFADFVDAAAAAVGRRGHDRGVIFNAVNGWPLEKVAPRRQVATYIEVWPPHVTYADLVSLVRRSHDLGPGKPVVLAAYPSFLRRARRTSAHAVANSLTLISAVILGSGAWHLLLGEGDAALAHPYYPKYVRLPADALVRLRRYYDFAVGYREFLRDPVLRDVAVAFVDSHGSSLRLSVPYSSVPTAGSVWVGVRVKPGWVVISLVNLLGEADIAWDRPRTARKLRDIRMRLPNEARIRRCLIASPDGSGSLAPATLALTSGKTPAIQLSLSTWSLVLLETDR